MRRLPWSVASPATTILPLACSTTSRAGIARAEEVDVGATVAAEVLVAGAVRLQAEHAEVVAGCSSSRRGPPRRSCRWAGPRHPYANSYCGPSCRTPDAVAAEMVVQPPVRYRMRPDPSRRVCRSRRSRRRPATRRFPGQTERDVGPLRDVDQVHALVSEALVERSVQPEPRDREPGCDAGLGVSGRDDATAVGDHHVVDALVGRRQVHGDLAVATEALVQARRAVRIAPAPTSRSTRWT